MWGALRLVAQMVQAHERGSVVTLLCDGGERYLDTYYSDDWVNGHGLRLQPHTETLKRFVRTGQWPDG
jgi:cysteine synthase A